jgi:hypothetical protein
MANRPYPQKGLDLFRTFRSYFFVNIFQLPQEHYLHLIVGINGLADSFTA